MLGYDTEAAAAPKLKVGYLFFCSYRRREIFKHILSEKDWSREDEVQNG